MSTLTTVLWTLGVLAVVFALAGKINVFVEVLGGLWNNIVRAVTWVVNQFKR
jgi:hypothetical protein